MESHVRKAKFSDAYGIFELIQEHTDKLISLSISNISQNIDRFFVYEEKGQILGCVSWAILPEIGKPKAPTLEIKSLAVHSSYQKKGIGSALVTSAIDNIKDFKPTQIIALTFAKGFFKKLGFVEVDKASLIHKIYTGCINCTRYESPLTCPEIAMGLSFPEHKDVH
ncbi:MAG: GNAT family N-acetyltransferase [Kiritimatiellae bacterium]|jgi:amino-acid N-acetyltransferase|nr:GNAT family N-acetyltransferase [Kiritimatiellia bacterium]